MTTATTVFGAGAWGLTLAELLTSKGVPVTVWDIDAQRLDHLRATGDPGKPPGLKLPSTISYESDLKKAVGKSKFLVSVVPSFAVRSLCGQLRDAIGGLDGRIFVSCSKGIEEETLLLASDIVTEHFGPDAVNRMAGLSGPSHAEEVCRRVPTVVVSASPNHETAMEVQNQFMLPTFRIYTQSDLRGVEVGGALKNVIAIAAGAVAGLGFGDNTKAALITRGLAEMTRAAVAMGGNPMTLAGIAGLGDLVVTAMSQHSRNHQFGERVARGSSVEQALKDVGAVVEGYRNSHSAWQLSQKLGIEMPITEAVYGVCHEGKSIKEVIIGLLSRDPKPENY